MSISIVQGTLKKIVFFEAYYGDVISTLSSEPVEEILEQVPIAQQVREIEIDVPSVAEEILMEKRVRRFPLLHQLDDIDAEDLFQQGWEIVRLLKGRNYK